MREELLVAREKEMSRSLRRISAGLILALAVTTGGGASYSTAAGSDVCAAGTTAPDGDPSAQTEAGSSRSFAVDLLAAASGNGGHTAIVAPLSVEAVLGMTFQGASEPLRNAILRLFAEDVTVWRPEHKLAAVLSAAGTDGGVELSIANGAFAAQELDVFPAFRAALEDRFGAKVARLDFSEPQSTETINTWVKSKTNGMIPRLLESLGSDTVLLLVNALHFKGEWTHSFDPALTAPRPFQLGSGEVVERETMLAVELPALHRKDEDFEAVQLAYGDGGFALTVVLPRPGLAPADALGKIKADPSWFGSAGFGKAIGTLRLPRLDLDYKSDILPLLEQLGLAEALRTPGALSGIAVSAPVLSQVVHAARLALDEEGTEAGAATAAIIGKSMPGRFQMQVDRPFALSVHKRGSGDLLFTAWVDEPGRSDLKR